LEKELKKSKLCSWYRWSIWKNGASLKGFTYEPQTRLIK